MAGIPLVYVAGPFSAPDRAGVEKNIEDAVRVGIEIARLGVMPVIPHANTADPWFARVQPYEFWCTGTLELMRRCDAVVMVKGWKRSRGARAEYEEAIARGMPVFFTLQELQAWLDTKRES